MENYWQSAALMCIGGLLGILFVALLRRQWSRSELHFRNRWRRPDQAGQRVQAAKILFANMGVGAFQCARAAECLRVKTFAVNVGAFGKTLLLRTSTNPDVATVTTGGISTFTSPAISPAYLGVGFIIGPNLAALNFAGGVLAWGLMVPLLTYLLGPQLQQTQGGATEWGTIAGSVYFSIVRPIAVGGMLVGAGYTLFRMRSQLALGMARAIGDLKKSAEARQPANRTERDLNAKAVFLSIGLVFLAMVGIYYYFISAGTLAGSTILAGAVLAALVMLILGFLRGRIGKSGGHDRVFE